MPRTKGITPDMQARVTEIAWAGLAGQTWVNQLHKKVRGAGQSTNAAFTRRGAKG